MSALAKRVCLENWKGEEGRGREDANWCNRILNSMWSRQNQIQPFPWSGSSNQRSNLTPDCTPDILLQISPWAGRSSVLLQGVGSPPRTSLGRKQSLCPGSPFDPRRRTSPPYWSGHYPRGTLPPGSKRGQVVSQASLIFFILQSNICTSLKSCTSHHRREKQREKINLNTERAT